MLRIVWTLVALIAALPVSATAGALRLPKAEVGAFYEASVLLPGVPLDAAYTISWRELPTGLALDPDGVVRGIPLLRGSSRFEVTATWTDGLASKRTTIRVRKPVEIRTSKLRSAEVGRRYKRRIVARRGLRPYLWEVVGALPPGLELDVARGRVEGVPSIAGDFPIEIRVTDSLGGTDLAELVLSVEGGKGYAVEYGPATRYDQEPGTFGGATAIGDVNGDGRNDVVFQPRDGSSTFLVYRQNISGQLDPAELIPTNVHSGCLALGDVNGDGYDDIVVGGKLLSNLPTPPGSLGRILVFRQHPDTGVLLPPEEIVPSSHDCWAVGIGDVDSDGRSDVVVANGRLSVFRQDGDGNLAPEEIYDDFSLSHWIRIADMDGDGDEDIVARSGMLEFAVLYQDGSVSPGIVASEVAYHAVPTSYQPTYSSLETGDVNGDGRNDVVTGDRGNNGYVGLFLQQDDGTLGSPVLLQPWFGPPYGIELRDMNGDGLTDIAGDLVIPGAPGVGLIRVLFQNPDHSFAATVNYQFSTTSGGGSQATEALSVGDVTGDGFPDAVVNWFSEGIFVLPGRIESR